MKMIILFVSFSCNKVSYIDIIKRPARWRATVNKKKYFPQIICLILATVHICVTFISDKNIFTFPNSGEERILVANVDYVLCKCISFFILYLFYYGLYLLIMRKEEGKALKEVLLAAAPYFIVVATVLAIKLPGGYLTNDENSIYANAISLTHDTWFYYLTTYYYIIALMLLPFKYGPIMVKAIIQLLTVGYVVYRSKKYFGSRLGMWSYVIFFLYPIIAYIASAHRLPIYFLVYLMLFTKLIYDGLEKVMLNKTDAFIIILTTAILTQWRTEGIYLLVIIPLLCFLTYSNLRNKKAALIFIVLSLLVQYLVSIPQNGFTAKDLDAAANDRMKPFYAYTITNMYRNGLDLEKNAQDLAIVDKYLSLETIKAINEYYVDINYEDVLILYKDGFIGVREEASVEDFINYSDALKRIFINNPGVFLKTRWGAFCYAALPYHITFDGMGIKQLISFGISIVKTVLYNLFIPALVILVLAVYSLVKRKWFSLFVAGGLCAHWFIVFVLAPASYFKYYFPVYIMGYFYVLITVLFVWSKRKKGLDIDSPIR